MTISALFRTLSFAVALAASGGASVARVAETPWDETRSSSVRLVAGGALSEGAPELLAGIQIRLAPGWKTYWRVPGDAGVPPVFDWSASTNVASVEVALPAPRRYLEPYATTIGYQDEVVFPVVVTPEDPALPVTARLEFAYAVCKDICLPVRSTFTLGLDGGATSYRSLIEGYRALVPVAGTGRESGVRAVSVEGEGAATRLVVDIEPAVPDTVPDVFVEGPEAFYFGVPEASAAAGGRLRLAIPVDGVTEARPLRGQTLKLTVVNGDARIEQTVPVP